MPAGEDKIRPKYFEEGRTHPNRARKRKTGFEGNNWPSTRTFYSDVPIHIVELARRFQYCTSILFKGSREDHHYLERISRHLGNYVSNYTIAGMLNKKWGVRHKPKPKTVVAIETLIGWMERTCKELKIWKPFSFNYDPSDLADKNKRKQHEKETKYKNSIIYRRKDREGENEEEGCPIRVNQYSDAYLHQRSRPRKSDQAVGLHGGHRLKIQG